MKNKIKLGISSVANCLKTYKFKRPMSVSEISSKDHRLIHDRDSTISDEELDEMFDRNLQLLKEFEREEYSSNVSDSSSKRYHSSLNVFINPNKNWRDSFGVYSSGCDIFPLKDLGSQSQKNGQESSSTKPHKRLVKSTLCSSYETLYDEFLTISKSKKKERNWETMSQSMIENNSNSISDFLNLDGDRSSDSDRTLKSLSSEDISSSVSSVRSQDFKPIVPQRRNRKVFSSNLNESMSDLPKIRQYSEQNHSRPNSCYADTTFGQYLSNKPPSRSQMVVIKTHESKEKVDLVISRPLGRYPIRSNNKQALNNYQSQLLYYPNSRQFEHENNKQHLSISNRNQSTSNILNNHFSQNGYSYQTNITKSSNHIPIRHIANPMKQSQLEQSINNQNYNHEYYPKSQSNVSTIEQNQRKNYSTTNVITNSEKSNQNFTGLSLLTTDNVNGQYLPNEVRCVPHPKSYQTSRIDNKA